MIDDEIITMTEVFNTSTKEGEFRLWLKMMLWNRNIPTPTQCVAYLNNFPVERITRANLSGKWSKIRIEVFTNFDLYDGLIKENGRWRWKDGWKPLL